MLTRINKLFSILLLLVAAFSANAQLDNPVTWKVSKTQISTTEAELVFTADIESGWTVYSQFLAEDASPVPTIITYDEMEGAVLDGMSTEDGKKKEGMDPIFEEHVIKFLADKPYIIKQKLKMSGDWSTTGYLTFMTCNDTKCLPPTDVEFTFSGSATDAPAMQSAGPSKDGSAAAENRAEDDIEDTLDEVNPIFWKYNLNATDDPDVFDLVLRAEIINGWQIYSFFNSFDEGPTPTFIDFVGVEGIKRVGDPVESGKYKKAFDPLFDMEVAKFMSDEAYTHTQKIRFDKDIDEALVYLTYMSCDDAICIPFDEELKLNKRHLSAGLSLLSDAAIIDKTPITDLADNEIDQLRPALADTYKAPIGDCGEGDNQEGTGLLSIFLIGFVGGLFAILLPCIFPMIPITVSYFMKDTKRKGWMNGLIYGLSIIVIFIGIGLAITAFLGPEALNKLSTNWIANTIFFLIFVAFAISFFGYYEITLPSSWSTKSDSIADKGGLIGTFFMAATLAIVSFSCTGPIIGTALVQVASNGDYWGPFLVMFGFSSALALPFGFFAAFPAWLNSLPSSGSWMTSVKVVLGFLELALALKFLSVADMTQHWGVLRYELFLGLWVIIFLAMGAYLLGWIRFPHDSKLTRLSLPRMAFAGIAIAGAVYLTMGFRYNDETATYRTPGLTSGITPPATYNFFLDTPGIDAALEAKYSSISKCANNITCFKDYAEGMSYAKETNKPVMLDFTGYGCVNCRKTEEHIWVDESVRDMLNDEYVLISLYVDDREKLDEILLSARTKKKMRNVGNKWSDFQIINFQQNSQPLYVLVTPDEKVIAQPRGYREGIEQYKDYLECGLRTYTGGKQLGSLD